MQCPTCGYQLSPFDKECPRCEYFERKGNSPLTASNRKPEPEYEIPVFDKVEEKSPLPEQVDQEVLVLSSSITSTHTHNSVRIYLLIILCAIVIILFATVYHNQSNNTHTSSDEQNIIKVARQARCMDNHFTIDWPKGLCDDSNKELDDCSTNISYTDDDDALVTFTEYNGMVLDKEKVMRSKGAWVTAGFE